MYVISVIRSVVVYPDSQDTADLIPLLNLIPTTFQLQYFHLISLSSCWSSRGLVDKDVRLAKKFRVQISQRSLAVLGKASNPKNVFALYQKVAEKVVSIVPDFCSTLKKRRSDIGFSARINKNVGELFLCLAVVSKKLQACNLLV